MPRLAARAQAGAASAAQLVGELVGARAGPGGAVAGGAGLGGLHHLDNCASDGHTRGAV